MKDDTTVVTLVLRPVGPEALAKTIDTPGWPKKPIGFMHMVHARLLVGCEVGRAG